MAELLFSNKAVEDLADITGKHIVFYRSLSDDTVEIVRILHERMDLKHRTGE